MTYTVIMTGAYTTSEQKNNRLTYVPNSYRIFLPKFDSLDSARKSAYNKLKKYSKYHFADVTVYRLNKKELTKVGVVLYDSEARRDFHRSGIYWMTDNDPEYREIDSNGKLTQFRYVF